MLEGFAGPLPFSRKWHEVLFEAFYLEPQGYAYMCMLESQSGFKSSPTENEKPKKVKQSMFLRLLLPVFPLPPTLAQSWQRTWLCA